MSTASASPTDRAAEPDTVRTRGYWSHALGRLTRQPVTLAAFTVLVAVFLVGGLAHVFAPHGWNDINLGARWQNHPPTLAANHFLGTDNIGRDVVARTLWGLHYSEQTALVGAAIAALIATAVGAVAGFYGGIMDAVLIRLADLVAGIPVLVLMIAAFVYLEPVTVWGATLVFAFSMWTLAARAVRARVATLVPEEFVQAARSLGASDARLLFRHVLPNAAGTIVVSATALVGQIILIESTAEFFGFGVSSLNRPTLGNLIGETAASGVGAFNIVGLGWWVWTAPAAVLALVLVCINLIGDGLATAVDVRAADGG